MVVVVAVATATSGAAGWRAGELRARQLANACRQNVAASPLTVSAKRCCKGAEGQTHEAATNQPAYALPVQHKDGLVVRGGILLIGIVCRQFCRF